MYEHIQRIDQVAEQDSRDRKPQGTQFVAAGPTFAAQAVPPWDPLSSQGSPFGKEVWDPLSEQARPGDTCNSRDPLATFTRMPRQKTTVGIGWLPVRSDKPLIGQRALSSHLSRMFGESDCDRDGPALAQRNTDGDVEPPDVHRVARRGVSGTGGPLPYLDQIQKSFGPEHDLSQVQAHIGGEAAEALEVIGAEACTAGNSMAFRDTPSLHTAAHEAAHVVQQRAGVQLQGGVGEVADEYERQADAVADLVVAGKSAAGLLPEESRQNSPGSLQLKASNRAAKNRAAKNRPKVPLADIVQMMPQETIDAFVQELPLIVKVELGSPEARRDFMDIMTYYLGSPEKVVTHFAGITEFRVGNFALPLHQRTVDKLKEVQEELKAHAGKDVMPGTTVGFALRGAHRHETSRGRMAHPLGFALDYRAVPNPQITKAELRYLLRIFSGGKTFIELSPVPRQYRSVIEEMGCGERDPETDPQAKKLLDTFEKEYHRLAQGSRRFMGSLHESTRARLAQLRGEYFAMRKPKKGARPSKEEQELRQREMLAEMDKLFQPWLERLDVIIADLKKRFYSTGGAICFFNRMTDTDLKKQEGRVRQGLSSAQRKMAGAQRGVARLEKMLVRLQDRARGAPDSPEMKKLAARIQEARDRAMAAAAELAHQQDMDKKLHRVQELLQLQQELIVLVSLRDALVHDLTFIFGSSGRDVQNPGVVQLLEKGFFTPDAESRDREFDLVRNGFNLVFMKAMLKHGFDQGVAWVSATDPMHFELVAGLSPLPQMLSKKELVRRRKLYQQEEPERISSIGDALLGDTVA